MADAKMPTDMRSTLLQGLFHLPENAGKEALILTHYGLVHGYPDLHFDQEMRVAIKRSIEAGPLGFSDTVHPDDDILVKLNTAHLHLPDGVRLNASSFFVFGREIKGVAFGVERVEQGS